MSHDHHHHHHSSRRSLALALMLTLGYAVVEAVGGWFSGSLALLGDAGHMFTDGLALALAAVASWLAARPASHRHSYGLGRAELLTALLNALLMIAIVVSICVAAVERIMTPRAVGGETVTVVAVIGLLINLGVAWLLSHEHHNINVRGALLHVLGDVLGSVAALIAGLTVTLTGWTPIDPILSLFIAALILFSALHLLRDTLHLLLDGVPAQIDLQRVGERLATVDGISAVHDLHIWQLSGERVALSAHLVVNDLAQWPLLLERVTRLLADDYAIDHVTLQPELPAPTDRLYQIGEPPA